MKVDTKMMHEAIKTLTEEGVLRWHVKEGCARAEVFLNLEEDEDYKPFLTIHSSEIEGDGLAGEETGNVVGLMFPVTTETRELILAKVPDLYASENRRKKEATA
jgi:hypothetical protein